MKLQNLTVIFIIIVLPIILMTTLYINTGLKTIQYQSLYDNGLLNATHDAIYAFELNTTNDDYSDNPEIKRDILKASVKMFKTSLCTTCNISTYNTDEIEQYIPAIVFGMYDGFYMYAPSFNPSTGKYEHGLKNYVYYSETIEGIGKDDTDVIIKYSLDNYVVVSGDFGKGYETREGYLIVEEEWEDKIDSNNADAKAYYDDAKVFTDWFNSKIGSEIEYLKIDSTNSPEDLNSPYVQHKRTVIKNKIEGVLNSSITAYSERMGGYSYKMPKLSEDDWQKIYSNISMITFFQGKSIGLTKYNGYCVLNSTNSREYVNPDLMYFIKDGEYHDIRCSKVSGNVEGYKIGDFQKKKVEQKDEVTGEIKTDSNGNTLYKYIYDRSELACYNCINGPLNIDTSIYTYVRDEKIDPEIKKSYFTSLARERYEKHKN